MTRVRLHFFLPSLIISLGLATPATFLGMYNPFRSERCSLTASPYMCDVTHAVKSNRGDGAWIYWLVYSTFLIMCNVLVVVFVSLLICQVFNQERKGDRFLMRGQETRRTNTIATGWQGIRYVDALMFTMIPTYVNTIFCWGVEEPPDILLFLDAIKSLFVGVAFSFVNFRPKYLAFRESNSDKSWIVCPSNVLHVDLCTRLQTCTRMAGSGERFDTSLDQEDLSSPLFQDNAESGCTDM